MTDTLSITAYYAGHVLGAVMFYISNADESLVYTGDYSMIPDRHLRPAFIERLNPDVCLTETTYATTVRTSRRAIERQFLRDVHECIGKGMVYVVMVVMS